MAGFNNPFGGNDITLDYNKLYDQMLSSQPTPPSLSQSMSNYFNGNLLGGYENFGNQMNGVMGAFGNVAAMNSANNQALNNANVSYAATQTPVEVARIQQQGQNDRLNALSPLLQGLFSGFGGNSGSGSAAPSGGMTGFSAVGPDGKQFASASLGGGGGSSGSQVGEAQPGNSSTAQPTNLRQYLQPTPKDYYGGLATGYGQPLSPEDTAAALARYKATGHYSPMPYATQGAGISTRVS